MRFPSWRSAFAIALFGSSVAGAGVSVVSDAVKPAIADKQAAPAPDQVKLEGFLGGRIMASEKNRLLTVDEDLLLDPFRKRPGPQAWAGEHIGKWMHAAALAWAYTGDPKLREKLDRVVTELLKTQHADGYLGTYLDKDRWTQWDVWVHKYNLLGLLAYYRYTGETRALDASKKMADLLCANFGRDKRDIIKAGEHVGMAATSVLEPMLLLHRLTGDAKYLEFCRYILWAWDQPHGPKVLSSLAAGKGAHQTGNGKAYEMISNLIGLCELYRTTGEKELLPPVQHAWEDIAAKRLYITGSASVGEFFKDDHVLPHDAESHIMENCVTVSWIQLNAQLLRLTGEARYANMLERTVYNQLLFAQKADGSDFCYFSPLAGTKEWGHLGRPIHCCLSSGPRGMALIPTFAYGVDDEGIVVNFYESGSADLVLKDGLKVRVEQKSRYLDDGTVVLAVRPERTAAFKLKMRTPGWCNSAVMCRSQDQDTELKLPSEQPAPPEGMSIGGGYDALETTWKGDDWITIKMAMPVRVVTGRHTNEGKIALMRGPLVLAADEGLNPEAKPLTQVALAGKSVDAKPEPVKGVRKTSDQMPTFRVLAYAGGADKKETSLVMVPFALAGEDQSYYQVWFPKVETAP